MDLGTETAATGKLAGRRVLVVEDSPLIATVLEDMLQDLGCTVVGPIGNMAFAVDLAKTEAMDAAIIDLNIRGGKVYPVAEVLRDRNIPFLLASGYADWTLREDFKDRPRLTKPYSAELVEQKLLKLLELE
ncbi:MAG TPA: response regulator [Allosphingosinicella sp.]|nr:response regulator [Allosphingosinicella sp.]